MIKKAIKKLGVFRRNFVEIYLLMIFSKSGFLANLYYCLFSTAFTREHLAVLRGKVKHLEETRKHKVNYFLLVRNTHRIEKGLLMRPQKKRFATEYISETVDSFCNIWNVEEDRANSNPQQKWFKDVLTEYFNKVGDTPLIVAQRKRFQTMVNGRRSMSGDPMSIPYYKKTSNSPAVNFGAFYNLTLQRRSVRWYLPDQVPRELIDKAILAARQSPSACNRQPFEFRIFDNPELVGNLVEIPMGTRGYGHSIPVVIVVVGNLDAYASERDRHVIYIDGALASMSFMLALETMGLSSCPINWPDIEEKERKMEAFLDLNKYQRPLMCIGLGYPDPKGKVAFSEKRSLDQIRSYN